MNIKKIIEFILSLFKKKENITDIPDLVYHPTIIVPSYTIEIPDFDWTNALSFTHILWHHSKAMDGEMKDWPGTIKYHTSYRIDYCIVTKEEFFERRRNGDGKRFEKPMSKVGYYAAIEYADGKVIIQVGRPLNMPGEHAIGFNGNSYDDYTGLGVCLLGDYDKVAPSKEKWKYVVEFSMYLLEKTALTRDKVIGHRETYPMLGKAVEKTCPGSEFDLDRLRGEI